MTAPHGPAAETPEAAAPAPRVLIADDQDLVRTGFRLILTARGIDVVGVAADGVEAVSLARRLRPDVVLLDIRMPNMDGLEAARRILAESPECRVIMLTTFDLDQYVYAALAAGASGFLLKDVTPEHLAAAVRLVGTGDALLAPSITRRLVERCAPAAAAADTVATADTRRELAALTPREREVLTLMGHGRSNSELAHELTLSEATVKTHVARIFAKLSLRDRAQAVVLAYETGLVAPGSVTPARQAPPAGSGPRR
ncbi:response regulator [Streptomyces sp. NPDC090085]|uniref:response regulator n=1 Tax=Streptomyces sp. NPDC090085 TaxID=3365943 RepID=UPI0038126C5D